MSTNLPYGNLQDFCRFRLFQFVVPKQVDHLLFNFWKHFDGLVKLSPDREFFRIATRASLARRSQVPRSSHCFVERHCRDWLHKVALGTIIVTSHVSFQFSPQLQSRQSQEIAWCSRNNLCQRAMESNHRLLKDIVCLLPASNSRKVSQHAFRKNGQPVRNSADDFIACPQVTAFQAFQAILQKNGRVAHCCKSKSRKHVT